VLDIAVIVCTVKYHTLISVGALQKTIFFLCWFLTQYLSYSSFLWKYNLFFVSLVITELSIDADCVAVDISTFQFPCKKCRHINVCNIVLIILCCATRQRLLCGPLCLILVPCTVFYLDK